MLTSCNQSVTKHRWTPEDVAYLRRHASDGAKRLAAWFDVSERAVRTVASRYCISLSTSTKPTPVALCVRCRNAPVYTGHKVRPAHAGMLRQEHPKAFFVIVNGDSVDEVFAHGRLVLIDPDVEPHDRDFVAIIVNGDEVTIKRIFFAGDVIVLHPASTNPKHKARTIDVSNPDAPPVRILGVAVWDVAAKSQVYR